MFITKFFQIRDNRKPLRDDRKFSLAMRIGVIWSWEILCAIWDSYISAGEDEDEDEDGGGNAHEMLIRM